MNKNSLILLLPILFTNPATAADRGKLMASSPEHRAVLLELYTSEGCSSCPPADKWLTRLKESGITGENVVPLAFHVSYWDYIGWKDRFADKVNDRRQRQLARYNQSNTVYTPQVVYNGDDYRRYQDFAADISKTKSMPSQYMLTLNSEKPEAGKIKVSLLAESKADQSPAVDLYLALYENNLSSTVSAGENSGETLAHDFVVRKFFGPVKLNSSEKNSSINQTIMLNEKWKQMDIGLVGFVQDKKTGEVLQAVHLKL